MLLGDPSNAALELVLEGVADRDELGAFAGVECLGGRAGTAPAAADQAQPDRIAARRIGPGADAGGQRRQ